MIEQEQQVVEYGKLIWADRFGFWIEGYIGATRDIILTIKRTISRLNQSDADYSLQRATNTICFKCRRGGLTVWQWTDGRDSLSGWRDPPNYYAGKVRIRPTDLILESSWRNGTHFLKNLQIIIIVWGMLLKVFHGSGDARRVGKLCSSPMKWGGQFPATTLDSVTPNMSSGMEDLTVQFMGGRRFWSYLGSHDGSEPWASLPLSFSPHGPPTLNATLGRHLWWTSTYKLPLREP